MALARQAQRCAVGKLDCYCGCRYCGYHNDADGVQVRRVHERKFILNLLDLKSCSGKIYCVGNSSTQDVACSARLLLLSSLLQLNMGGMSCMQFSETIPAKAQKRSLTLSREIRRKWKTSSGRLKVS